MDWPPLVPDRLRSRAVLVGTATYTDSARLPPVPAAVNVTDLYAALTGPAGVLDGSAVACVVDPTNASEVLTPLSKFGRQRGDLLLFYYAGHGLRDEGGRLCFGLPQSVDLPSEASWTSLLADAVFDVLGRGAATHRVAIVDCCYAGLALDSVAAAEVHLLTACGRTTKAVFADQGRTTAFTDALLRLLDDGLADGPQWLELDTVYRCLDVKLRAAGRPTPHQRTVNASGAVALARNAAYGSARTRLGLHSRAVFAEQVGRSGHPDRAAALFAGIVADASDAFSHIDADTVRYRHAHASWTGTAGDPAQALRLLETVVAQLSAATPRDDPALREARRSQEFWNTALRDQ